MKYTISIIALLFAAPALAYIDPGSGSAILSAIAGLLVALTMAVKSYWYKIKSFFMGSTKKTEKQKPSDEKSS